jgi:ABC-type bacteriocin/lantibiotic exporter with double-glycine peptidase domain
MQIAGVVAGCGRIQAFLLLKEQETVATEGPGNGMAVVIDNASFSTDDGNTLLTDINMRMFPRTINMVVGKVGSGKSSLLKAIIGENMPSQGTIRTETSVGYCDQVPWLRNTTIRNNITGQSQLDEKWLATVIRSCALDEDLAHLPQGQETIVGSRGVALSGGQKQRVALARAVYSRSNLIVLDDVFSSLDQTTSNTVFHRLLGANGLLRASTVILATSNGRLFLSLTCTRNLTISPLSSICRLYYSCSGGSCHPQSSHVL